jgi:DNA replication and repair protein RecF
MVGASVEDLVTGMARADAAPARVTRLAIRDFRNLARVDLDVSSAGIALIGDNGHGKTNLLEAVYYLHHFRSMRGARDPELVRFGAAGFHVAADLSGARADSVAAGCEPSTGRRRVVVDGVACDRLSDALGMLPAVAFSPSDVAIVAGSPAERRHYLDLLLASGSRRYLAALRDYRTALAQRNAALRSGSGRAQAAAFETPLAEHGAILRLERAAFVAWAQSRVTGIGEALGERQPLGLRYRSSVAIADDDHGLVRDRLAEAFAASRDRDVERGLTHAGPHRDDLDLRLGDTSLRRYGSAGQQRSAAIALRLLECAWSREREGREPVLLLDDPVAELDPGRAARVLDLLTARPAGQVLLAVPRPDDVPERLAALARCAVRDGTVTPMGVRDA